MKKFFVGMLSAILMTSLFAVPAAADEIAEPLGSSNEETVKEMEDGALSSTEKNAYEITDPAASSAEEANIEPSASSPEETTEEVLQTGSDINVEEQPSETDAQEAILTDEITLSSVFEGTPITIDAGYVKGPTDASSIIGSLSILVLRDGPNVQDGHSYLLFTSYYDNLTLSFQDLYGYYQFTDAFKEATEEDISQLSYKSGNNSDECFTSTFGETSSDERFKSTQLDYLLNTGDYLTIGNYSMQNSMLQMVSDTFHYSSLFSDFNTLLESSLQDGVEVSADQILETVQGYYEKYVNGELNADSLYDQCKEFISSVVSAEKVETICSYLTLTDLINGDTTGGLFVNKELYRQKSYQDLYPNAIYSKDITARQLENLMNFINTGNNNRYSLLTHNCSSVSSGGWNAAFGYILDENGNNTEEKSALYIDSKDDSISMLSGIFDTPNKIYRVLLSWIEAENDGSLIVTYGDENDTDPSWRIVHGMTVPKSSSDTAAPTADITSANVETGKAASAATSTVSVKSSDHTSPQTSDGNDPGLYVMLLFLASAGVLMASLKMRRI